MDEITPIPFAPLIDALPDARPIATEAATVPPAASPRREHCLHCNEALVCDSGRHDWGRSAGTAAPVADFCCSGCAAAFATIRGLGLDSYYRRRVIDPRQRPIEPAEEPPVIEYAAYSRDEADGTRSLSLMIEGIHCGACVWLIESVLTRASGVVSAHVNMTTRRLALTWNPQQTDADALAATVTRLRYGLVPYDPALIGPNPCRPTCSPAPVSSPERSTSPTLSPSR